MKKITPTVELKQSDMCLLDVCLERLGLGRHIDTVHRVLNEYEDCPSMPHDELLETVFDEIVYRVDEQKAEMRTKMARFPNQSTIENFEFNRIGQAVEALVRGFSKNCAWIKRHENILFKGPSGVGKTHLSIALGRQATALGYSTLFVTANELFDMLNLALARNTYESKLRCLQRNDLLIIDELGIPLSKKPMNGKIFYDVMNGRCGKKSTIITTNRKVTDWFETLGGDVVSIRAGLDRFLESCHRVEIQGKSYRLEAFKALNSSNKQGSSTATTEKKDATAAELETSNLDNLV